jgi:hypothetical protein
MRVNTCSSYCQRGECWVASLQNEASIQSLDRWWCVCLHCVSSGPPQIRHAGSIRTPKSRDLCRCACSGIGFQHRRGFTSVGRTLCLRRHRRRCSNLWWYSVSFLFARTPTPANLTSVFRRTSVGRIATESARLRRATVRKRIPEIRVIGKFPVPTAAE